MAAIQIKISGLSGLVSELREIPQSMERIVIARLSQVAYDSAERGADAHTKTGALRQSLYNRAIEGGRSVGHDPIRAPHALFVNFGTRPHVIKPKNKKALRWVSGNSFVFAGSVNHPGYRGDNYMERAARDAIFQFDRIVSEAISRSA